MASFGDMRLSLGEVIIEVFFLFIILLIVHLFHSGSLGLKPTLQIFSFFWSYRHSLRFLNDSPTLISPVSIVFNPLRRDADF